MKIPSHPARGPALTCLLCTALVAFLVQADVYAARQGLLPLPPIALLAVFAGVAGLVLLPQAAAALPGPTPLVRAAEGAPLWVAMIFFAAWGLLRASLDPGPFFDLRQALFPVADLFVVLAGASAGAIPAVGRRWRGVATLAFAVLLLSLLADGWIPGTFSKQVSRAAGLAGNANLGGLRLVLLAAVAVRYRRPRAGDFLILALCGLGVFLTLSRSALTLFGLWTAICLAAWALSAPWKLPRRLHAATALAILGVAASLPLAGAWMVRGLPQFSTEYGQARLAMLGSFEGFLQGERGTRLQLVEESLERIGERPLLGYGPGFTSTLRPGPHNQYLKVWMDHGLPGLILFCLVLLGAGIAFLGRGSSAGVVLVLLMACKAVFSHNMLEDRTGLLLLGLLLGSSRRTEESDADRSAAAAPGRLPGGMGRNDSAAASPTQGGFRP